MKPTTARQRTTPQYRIKLGLAILLQVGAAIAWLPLQFAYLPLLDATNGPLAGNLILVSARIVAFGWPTVLGISWALYFWTRQVDVLLMLTSLPCIHFLVSMFLFD